MGVVSGRRCAFGRVETKSHELFTELSSTGFSARVPPDLRKLVDLRMGILTWRGRVRVVRGVCRRTPGGDVATGGARERGQKVGSRAQEMRRQAMRTSCSPGIDGCRRCPRLLPHAGHGTRAVGSRAVRLGARVERVSEESSDNARFFRLYPSYADGVRWFLCSIRRGSSSSDRGSHARARPGFRVSLLLGRGICT